MCFDKSHIASDVCVICGKKLDISKNFIVCKCDTKFKRIENSEFFEVIEEKEKYLLQD
jgi:hypothetical protein